MIDLKEAVDIVLQANPGKLIVDASEFPDFYGFFLVTQEDIGQLCGGGLKAVRKENGEMFEFSPISDLKLFASSISRTKEVEEILNN